MTTLNQNNFLTFEELHDAIENDNTENNFKECAINLLNAVTDWPTFDLKDPKDLVYELKMDIENPLTYDNLDNYINILKNDILQNAFKIDALNSLLEMFDFKRTNNYDRKNELETVIELVTNHYRTNK